MSPDSEPPRSPSTADEQPAPGQPDGGTPPAEPEVPATDSNSETAPERSNPRTSDPTGPDAQASSESGHFYHRRGGRSDFDPGGPGDDEPDPKPSRGAGLGRFLGPLAGGALLLGKLKGLLGALKFLAFFKSGASLLLFVLIEAWAFGWPSAVVITALLVTMSLGRLFALKLQRRQATPMIFIPFLGGGAGAKARGEIATQDAFVSIMGPVFGAVSALVCAGLYLNTDSKFWLVMASLAFMLNLFQLLPAPGLAGGSIALLISPKLLLPGIAVLLLVGWQSILVWFIALMALPYAFMMWKAKPSDDPYLARVTSADRWKYGLSLLAIALVLGLGNRFCDDRLHELRQFLG